MDQTLIVSDLDGTLLNEKQKISTANAQSIKKFMQSGGLFTFATGRMEKTVRPYIQQLGINLPVILYNGAKIYNPVTNTSLYEKSLKVPKVFWNMINAFNSDNVGVLVYQNSEVMCLDRNPMTREYEKKENIKCSHFTEEVLNDPITKILIISPAINLLKDVERRISSFDWEYDTVYSEPDYLEILPKGVSKGNALRHLTEYLQITNLRTIAVGDNLNDISLLNEADIGYAVENANDLLKKTADKMTVHHRNHAIKHIINEFNLIKV